MQKKNVNIGYIGFGRVVQWQIKQLQKLNISVKLICDNCEEKLNNAKKIPYDQLTNIDSEAANNGFAMLVRDLENISNFVKYSGFTFPLLLVEAFFHLMYLQMKTIKNKFNK